ncbi:hypothetical protein KCO_16087 [Pectobacterium brasiliense ICMP 19477]|nr:hypothetical protein KCO_16087 [Pectobacterium brasiliense ICMP 19477]
MNQPFDTPTTLTLMPVQFAHSLSSSTINDGETSST